jgi:hypothetical protein
LRPIVASIGLGALLLGSFCVRALGGADPLLDLRLLRHPPFAAGLAVLVTFGAGYFGAFSILPIFVQGVRGDPAALAGAIGIPQALAVGLTMQVATRLVDRVPPQRIVLTGVLLGVTGTAGLLAATASDAGYPLIITAAVVLGIGSGATILPTMTVALRELEGSQTARGTTLVALAQQLAAALGAAAVATSVALLVPARVPGLAETGDDGLAGMLALDPAARRELGAALAGAVGSAYTIPLVLIALSVAVAAAGLARGSRAGSPKPACPPQPSSAASSPGRSSPPAAYRR